MYYNGSLTLAESDSESGTDSMKFYCQWVSVSVDTSIQFHTSHFLLGLALGLGQCEHTLITTTDISVLVTLLVYL